MKPNMKVYRPVKTNILYQKFGENMACAKVSDGGVAILPYIISSKVNNVCPVGTKEFYPLIGMKGHNGEDWGAFHGEPVYFNVDIPGMKWWARVEVDDAKGINLYVFSLDPVPFDELPPEASEHARSLWLSQDKKIHICFLYVHGNQTVLENKPKIQIGEFAPGVPQWAPEIKLGDLILFADNTGASSGDHLHHSMKFRFKNSMIAGGDNGYAGAISYAKWFDNRFILDVIGTIVPPPDKPHYQFNVDLEYGKKHPDVIKLQEILKYEGLMDKGIEYSDNYGPRTREAVLAYQKKYKLINLYQELVYKGMYCYSITRNHLNKNYG